MPQGPAQGAAPLAQRLRASVGRAVVGKDDAVDLALCALLCGGHVLIEDVPGIGKTTLARALAASLGLSFGRIQFTLDLMPADVLGVNYYSQKTADFHFRPGPVFSQVLLADEINRATPRTQSALLEAMQEGQVTIDGETMALPDPFLVLATQNPVELEGTFPLPEAQLDRFMVRLQLGYPSAPDESEIYRRAAGGDGAQGPAHLNPVATASDLAAAAAAVSLVSISDPVTSYITALVHATRASDAIELGASPRAGIALYRSSQARAALSGRDYVLPDDVKQLAVPVLAHRMIPAPSARLRGQGSEEILSALLGTVPVPVGAGPTEAS